MRVAFLGNAAWSVPSLEAVAGSAHSLALVATRAPRPAGRGRALRPTPVAGAARRLGLPLREVDTVKSGPGLEALREAEPDVLAVVAYGEILPAAVLGVPGVAPVNVHFSLLPALRGAAPVARAILEGYATTGVTTIRMDEGMDTGPILLQEPEPIREDDDAGSLGGRLADVGGALLVRTLDGLARGDLEEHPQDHRNATVAPPLRREEEWIDWAEPAAAVTRRVRALAPEPGARTTYRGRTLKVVGAGVADGAGAPGTVAAVRRDGIVVAAGTGGVLVREVIPEGRRRMPAADFARGARPQLGERLGETGA